VRHPADLLDKIPERENETQSPAESPALQDAELWARRALGTDRAPVHDDRQNYRQPTAPGSGGDGRHAPVRRRFARDGEVTVVLAPPGSGVGTAHRFPAAAAPPVNRLATAEAALAAEQAARQRADRALNEAQSAIKRLQTLLAHVEMTCREATENARQAESDRSAMAAALQLERAARQLAEAALQGAAEALPKAPGRGRGRPRLIADLSEPQPVKRPRGRPRRVPGAVVAKREKEQKPVKWW
jgi:hypothetical protein